MNKILSIIIFAWSINALASEDDKNAGACAGYLINISNHVARLSEIIYSAACKSRCSPAIVCS